MIPSSLRAVLFLALLSGSWSSAAAGDCEHRYRTLSNAVDSEDYGCVKELLEEGYGPNYLDSSYYTPLRRAADKNLGDIAKLLMSYGALPNYKYRVGSGDLALVDAACKGCISVVKALVDAGASAGVVTSNLKTASESACTCYEAPKDCSKSEVQGLLNKPSIAVYFGRDFPSKDGILNDGSKDITYSNRDCHNKCANTNGCKVWTRIKRATGSNKEGECWLRSYQPSATKCDHCDSGVMSCGILNNTDYTTKDDLLSYSYDGITKSNQDCCALCYGTEDCKSWTRIKWDTKSNKKDECWLRSGYSDGKYNKATASGQI